MIIFDYGNTLVEENAFDGVKGIEAIIKCALSNPKGTRAEAIAKKVDELYAKALEIGKVYNIEVPYVAMQRYALSYYGFEFDMSQTELEQLYWDAASVPKAKLGVEGLIAFLNERGIRSAVVSNIAFSGINLEKRLNSLFPNNNFEFVISSSDYGYRKPDVCIYELAVSMSGLDKKDIWYCGDKYEVDISGAKNAGICGILIDSDGRQDLSVIEEGTLVIRSMDEIVDYIKKGIIY